MEKGNNAMQDLEQRIRCALYDWDKNLDIASGEELRDIINELAEREAQLSKALVKMIGRTYSHIEPYEDLLDIMHPRYTLDIKRRVDGKEDWFEGDWLSNLWGARKEAEATLSALGIEPKGE